MENYEESIRKVLKDSKFLSKETNKNFIIKCPYCGDRNKKHQGHDHEHCYISKDIDNPVFHCFYCNVSGPVTKLLFDITGKSSDNFIKIDKKYNPHRPKINNINLIKSYKLPDLRTDYFIAKTSYMEIRTFHKMNVSDIPNLIFDIVEFFKINNIDPLNDLHISNKELEFLQHNFIVFLSKRNTMLYCRNIDPNASVKFRKIFLQKSFNDYLDYYEISLKNKNSDTVILAEGNFDILGCYVNDTLKLNNKALCYISGCTFSYTELLKSISYDKCLYNANVYILSDNDKKKWHYTNFIRNSYTAKTINIVYNRFGKDFGCIKQQAVKLY